MYMILVASDSNRAITGDQLEQVQKIVELRGLFRWLAPGQAVELSLVETPTPSQHRLLKDFFADDRIDCFMVSAEHPRRKKMLVCDMDSTIVKGETLDNLAKNIGLKEKIASITSRTMAGELDFCQSLRERLALLEGLPESLLEKELTRLRYTEGAWELVNTMARAGAHCILVSGGFTCFTRVVAEQLGFHHHHGNSLLFAQGRMTGKVEEPVLNRNAKYQFLKQYCQKLDIDPKEVLAVGDGANDLDMLQAAGLGVGFHPKPFLRERVENSILYGDLRALLYIQGFTLSEIAEKQENFSC